MVEQSPEKACVGGSIPSLATISLKIFKKVLEAIINILSRINKLMLCFIMI